MKEENIGKICEKCVYYNDCYFDHDCRALMIIKKAVMMILDENMDCNNTDD